MSNVTDIETTKTKIARLLSKATPRVESHPYPALWTVLGISLIGTMLPFRATVTFFSLTAVIAFIVTLILLWKKQLRFSKSATAILTALLATSILTGCSPALFGRNNPELYQLIQERDYKYFSMQEFGVFGLGLDDLNISNAQLEGDIETVYVARIDNNYGIVSISRITVAGK